MQRTLTAVLAVGLVSCGGARDESDEPQWSPRGEIERIEPPPPPPPDLATFVVAPADAPDHVVPPPPMRSDWILESGGTGACASSPIAVSSDGFARPSWYMGQSTFGIDLGSLAGWGPQGSQFVVLNNLNRTPCYGVDYKGGVCGELRVVDATCPAQPVARFKRGLLHAPSSTGRYVLLRSWPVELGTPELHLVDLAQPTLSPRRVDVQIARFLSDLPGAEPSAPAAIVQGLDLLHLVYGHDSHTLVVTIDPSTLRVERVQRESERLRAAPIADEAGRLFIGLGESKTVALNPRGAQLWEIDSKATPLAAYAGTVHFSDGTVRRISTGEKLYRLTEGSDVRFTLDHTYELLNSCDASCTRLRLLDRFTGSEISSTDLPFTASGTVLLDDGSVLFGVNTKHLEWSDNPWSIQYGHALWHFDPRAGSREPVKLFEYLPPGSHVVLGLMVVDDHVVLLERGYPHNTYYSPPQMVVGFNVPDLKPMRSGWVAPLGNPGGTRALSPDQSTRTNHALRYSVSGSAPSAG